MAAGARVVKMWPSSGLPWGVASPRVYAQCHGGKEEVGFDRRALAKLLAQAAVLVTDYARAEIPQSLADDAARAAAYPQLVVVRVSPTGGDDAADELRHADYGAFCARRGWAAT